MSPSSPKTASSIFLPLITHRNARIHKVQYVISRAIEILGESDRTTGRRRYKTIGSSVHQLA